MKNILVVGDTIEDKYVFGSVDRINPEAHWSVVLDFESKFETLGGAANVAANIRTLSTENVNIFYAGYVSPKINQQLKEFKIKSLPSKFLYDTDIITKTRFSVDNHILLRLDENKDYKSFINTSKSDDLNLVVSNINDSIDVVVISDYDKKTLSTELLKLIFTKFHNSIFLFDIKTVKSVSLFNEFLPKKMIIKCNQKEYQNLSNLGFWDSLNESSDFWVVRTEGKHGYTIIEQSCKTMEVYPAATITEIVDVVGCGDVFLAGMAVKILEQKDFNIKECCDFGNKCAAIKIKKFGTAKIKREEVKNV